VKNRGLLLLLFFQMVLSSVAQPQELYVAHDYKNPARDLLADSIQHLLTKWAPDSLRIKWYNQLISLAEPGDEVAVEYSRIALNLAIKNNDQHGLAKVYKSLAGYFGTYGTGELDSSLFYFKKATEIALANEQWDDAHQYFSGMLNLYFYFGDFSKAMKLATQGLEIAEMKNDLAKAASYHNLQGFIYLRQGNLSQARASYQKYYDQSLGLNDSVKMYDAITGKAEVLLAEGKPQEALTLLRMVWRYYSNQFEKKGVTNFKSEKIPYALFTIAKVYQSMNENEVALEYCLKGFSYSRHFLFNQYDLAQYYIITANVYEDLGKYREAIETMNKGLALSLKIHHAENIRDAYGSIARIYARQKKFDSAYYYTQLHHQLKDSIVNDRVVREIHSIESKYALEKKDQEIAVHLATVNRQKLIRNIIVISTFLILIFLYLVYNRYQLKARNKFQQQLNLKQNELFKTITSIQDNERRRIAQDIHDQVGSVLSAAKLQLSGLEELRTHLTEDQHRKYASAMSLMDEAAEELRNISHNLMPATLSRLGLVAALRGLFDKISEYTSLKVNFTSHGFETRIDEPTEINIYPMVLELINNVVKHAHATEATVQLIRYPEYINISIEDNGIGFNTEMARNYAKGIGMQSLHSRVQYLNGSLYIDSAEGQGTTVLIDIPLNGHTK
jgi:two-component system, NarL family, sensor kinase